MSIIASSHSNKHHLLPRRSTAIVIRFCIPLSSSILRSFAFTIKSNNNNNAIYNDIATKNHRAATSKSVVTTAVPRQKWKDPQAQREFFDHIASSLLKIRHPDDWYRITTRDIDRIGGSHVLRYHGRSLIRALAAVYPEIRWQPWRFSMVPIGFWNDVANQRAFLSWAASEKLDVKLPEDWYRVTTADLHRLGGSRLLHMHGGSLAKALSAAYPEHRWLPWRFAAVPKGFWADRDNQRQYLEWAAHELGIRNPHEDWYRVTTADIKRLDGAGFLRQHNGSLIAALMSVFPALDLKPWKFRMVPSNYWTRVDNQRQFLDWAARELRLANHQDWYKVSNADIHALGGGRLLNIYGGSLMKALAAVYPEVEWRPWKLASGAPRNSWADASVISQYMAALAKELQIADLDDWYRVSTAQIRSLGGGLSILQRNGGLYSVLKVLHPGHPWDKDKFQASREKKASQRWLWLKLKELLPDGEEILEEYHHPGLRFAQSGELMQLDIFLPRLALAFEYQGEHHFEDVCLPGVRSDQQQHRDEEKALACKQCNITLITVPYWWDKSTTSLAAAIRKQRPDVVLRPTNASVEAANVETNTDTDATNAMRFGDSGAQQQQQQQQQPVVEI